MEDLMDKVVGSAAEAVSDIASGSVIGVGGFGIVHAFPVHLIGAVRDRALTDLVIVTNSLGSESGHPLALVQQGQVRKLIAAFSARPGSSIGSASEISPVPLDVELVPQGLLAERLRAAGAGMGPFFSPVAADTALAEGKERRVFGGRDHVLEQPLPLDYGLIYAHTADTAGNLVFRGASQNFGPSVAKASRVVIAEVDEIVDTGTLSPDNIGLPGIFVDRVIVSPVRREPVWREPRAGEDQPREYLGRRGRTGRQIAERVAPLLPEGSYVNLGVGLPTMVSDFLDGRDVTLHAENGLLGYGTRLTPGDADIDVFNAASEPVMLSKGASTFDTVEAFEMARGGRLDAVILGAYQVGADGTFANWTTPALGGGAIGGAMDLVVRPGKLIIAMWHCERSGQPKVVRECAYPPTGVGCVDLIVTDLAVIERDGGELILRECSPGFTPADVQQLTGAPLTVELWADMADRGLSANADRSRHWRAVRPGRRAEARLPTMRQGEQQPYVMPSAIHHGP
jgi:3-oxoacid CoA-transferase